MTVVFHRVVFSDSKLCVLEELWRSGNGLWFGEREGQLSHAATRDSTWDKGEFLPTHWVSGFHMDLGQHICFCNLPLLLISVFATLLSEEFKDGLCAALSPFPFFHPTLSFFSTHSNQQWQAFLCLESKGKQDPTDSLSTLQPRTPGCCCNFGWSLICLVRMIVAPSHQLEVLCVELCPYVQQSAFCKHSTIIA